MESIEFNLEGLDEFNERLVDASESLEKHRLYVFTHCSVSTHEQDGYLMNYEVQEWVTSKIFGSQIADIKDYTHEEIVVYRDCIDEPMPTNIPANTFKRVVTLTNGTKIFCL